MPSHVAASAFGHCLAMVGDEAVAADLAVVALGRGGRRLAAVLGHARHHSLAHLAGQPTAVPAVAPDAGPAAVATALAASRPAVERAVVDLSARYGLDRAGLGLALRMPPAAAAARVAEVSRAWEAALDPALLAWTGPGDCEELAATLAGLDRSSVPALVDAGRDVAAHVAQCPACADRLRAMASVRQLVVGAPLPTPPPAVVAAAGAGRSQAPVLPLPLDPGRRVSARQVAAAVAAVLAVATLAAVATATGRRGDDAHRRQAMAAAARTPAAAGVVLSPPVLGLGDQDLVVANRTTRHLGWEATTDATWVEVAPARGRLAPGGSQVLRLRVLDMVPEGDVRATVRVAGHDGSAAASLLVGTVERAPDIGTVADGCRVTATAEDESEVALTLHWREPAGERGTPMTPAGDGSVAVLPSGPRPLTWWVRAVDGRGNQARTADMGLPEGC